MEEEKEMCMNCKRDVSCSNYQMHTAHCARHITLCKKCDEPVPKKDLPNHVCETEETKAEQLQPPPEVQAAPKPQPRSNKKEINSSALSGTRPKVQSVPAPSSVRVQDMAKPPKEVVIPDKICQYCKLEFTQKQLDEHEDYCGSRTEQCPECSDFVMLKEWEKHQSMRLYHELAKKPSAVVFKSENDKRSLQRSASGIAIPNYINPSSNGLDRKSSQSNLYSYLQKGSAPSTANISKPFGDASIVKSSNDYNIPRKAKYSFDASLLNDKREELFADRLDQNFASETKLERRNSITSSTNRLDRSRRNSGTWGSRNFTESLSQPSRGGGQDGDEACSFGTSVDEQRKILEEIQRQQRRRSISRSRMSDNDVGSSTSSYRYRAKSSYTEYSSTNVEIPTEVTAAAAPEVPKRRTRKNSVTFETDQNITIAAVSKSSTSIVDRYRNTEEAAGTSHTSRTSRREEFMKTEKHEHPSVNTKISETRSKSTTNSTAGTSSKRKKSSIVDQILSKGANSFNDNYVDADIPDLLPFDTNFQALNKKVPSRFDRNAQNYAYAQYSTKKTNESNSYTKTTKNNLSKSTSFVEQFSSSSSQQSNGSNQKSRKRSTSRSNNLCRQNSVSNLSSLQNEISSMLNTNSNSDDSSRQFQSYSSISDHVSSSTASSSSSVIRSEYETQRAVQARCGYESIARSMMLEPPMRRRHIDGLNNTETNRETLREMLSKMRKDPMDEDLEKCDGEFFPCEFCGDPYPVEYIMRHQLSCDLNPNPVQEGNGFDYAEIARRAAATMALARD